MGEKHHKAKKKYWSRFTPEYRSSILSERRKKGWSKVSKADRLLHGRKLTDIRLAKQKKLSTS